MNGRRILENEGVIRLITNEAGRWCFSKERQKEVGIVRLPLKASHLFLHFNVSGFFRDREGT
jgi:hypothetical protein